MLGLAFDAAYLYHLKLGAQIAADAGARAAALELQNGCLSVLGISTGNHVVGFAGIQRFADGQFECG
jgi:hypothetical protein